MSNIENINKNHIFYWKDPEDKSSRIVKIDNILEDREISSVKDMMEMDTDSIIVVDGGTEVTNTELFEVGEIYDYCLDHAQTFAAMPMEMAFDRGGWDGENAPEEIVISFDDIINALSDDQHKVLSAEIEKKISEEAGIKSIVTEEENTSDEVISGSKLN